MGIVAEIPDEKPQFSDERQGLWALYTNADLSGGTVDFSRIGRRTALTPCDFYATWPTG